jgi:hypothetical protein
LTLSGISEPSSAADPVDLQEQLQHQDSAARPHATLLAGRQRVRLIREGERAVRPRGSAPHAVQREGERVEDVPHVDQ